MRIRNGQNTQGDMVSFEMPNISNNGRANFTESEPVSAKTKKMIMASLSESMLYFNLKR